MLSRYSKSIVHSKRTQELQQVEAGSVAGRTLVNNPLGNSTVSVHYNMMSGPLVAPPKGTHNHSSKLLGVDMVGMKGGRIKEPAHVHPIPLAEASASSGASIGIHV